MEKLIKSAKDMGIELSYIIDSYLSKDQTKKRINKLAKDYPDLMYNQEGKLRTTIVLRLGSRRMHILKDILLIPTEVKSNIIKMKGSTENTKTNVSWISILESMNLTEGNKIPPRRSISKCLDLSEKVITTLKSRVKSVKNEVDHTIEIIITNKRILWKVNPLKVFEDPYNKQMIELCTQIKEVYKEKGMLLF